MIENDAVRDYIVSEMNLAAPKYNSLERRKVYNVSWALIRLALSQRCHVVFDATNQTEAGRAGAYAAASEYGVNVLVVFMKASQEILRARYVAVNKERQNAFDKLGNRKYDHTKCSKHHVLVESDGQTDELFKRVADDIKIPFNLN